MERQAIPICLDTIRWLEKKANKEIKNIEKGTGLKLKNKNKIMILFSIVNYPTKQGKKSIIGKVAKLQQISSISGV